MQFHVAIPALPVQDIATSIPFYRDILGLMLRHRDAGFAIVARDTVELHLWQANDESWRTRTPHEPIRSGAESFITGTASCRIGVTDPDNNLVTFFERGA